MYDICIYDYGATYPRSYADMFAGTDLTYKYVPYRVPHEAYTRLPEKTYLMLVHLVTFKRCRAALKIDSDAVACLKNFRLDGVDLRNVYAGIGVAQPYLDWTRRHKLWTPHLEEMRANSSLRRSYHQGAAYVIGRNVALHVTRRPFESHFNTGWEDANVGLHTHDFKDRNMIWLSRFNQADTHGICLPHNETSVYHKCKNEVRCNAPNVRRQSVIR